MSALIVVDVQQDFCEGGSLAVKGGADLAKDIAEHLKKSGGTYEVVVATQDWHAPGDNDGHFSENPDYNASWPVHCVAGGYGSDFQPPLHEGYFDSIFHKGYGKASYSGFDGKNYDGYYLNQYLYNNGIEDVYIIGLAFDYCVKATALDAVKRGYGVVIDTSMTLEVADWEKTQEELQLAGVVLK